MMIPVPDNAERLEQFAQAVGIRDGDYFQEMGWLLNAYGKKAHCKGCAVSIFWVKHKNGKLAPYDAEGQTIGVNHFITCPQRAEFRKRGR